MSLPSASGLRTSSESKVMRLPFATTMINWFRQPWPSFPRFETGRPIPSMWSNCAKLIPQDFKGWLNSISSARAPAADRCNSKRSAACMSESRRRSKQRPALPLVPSRISISSN